MKKLSLLTNVLFAIICTLPSCQTQQQEGSKQPEVVETAEKAYTTKEVTKEVTPAATPAEKPATGSKPQEAPEQQSRKGVSVKTTDKPTTHSKPQETPAQQGEKGIAVKTTDKPTVQPATKPPIRIEHGSDEPSKLDSIKRAKGKLKK